MFNFFCTMSQDNRGFLEGPDGITYWFQFCSRTGQVLSSVKQHGRKI